MTAPVLLRGASEIATHLGISPGNVSHLDRQRLLPTFRTGGTPYATTGALDDWRALRDAGALPQR